MTREETAIARFAELYTQWKSQQQQVEIAAHWLIANACPYRVGQQIVCPVGFSSSAGKLMTITKIGVEIDPQTRIFYWAIFGDHGFTHLPMNRPPIETREPDVQDLLTF